MQNKGMDTSPQKIPQLLLMSVPGIDYIELF